MASNRTLPPETAPEVSARPDAAAVVGFFATLVIFAAGVSLLLWTNPRAAHWAQSYDPLHHWLLSTIMAGLPVIVLLGAMAIFRMKAHVAACVGLFTALAVAIAVFHMPIRLALTAASFGAGYGLFPIFWIILPVVFLYDLTVKAGTSTALQDSLASVTSDSRLQLLLIAFALGAFFEGAAGFGTPVAVCGAILIGLGFRPLQAAGLALLANTAPVAFGALGIPIVALHGVTGVDTMVLARTVSTILTLFCILVPFWLIWAFAGLSAMLEVWPAILVASLTFAGVQLFMATVMGPTLVSMVSAGSTILVLVAFLRFWKPRRTLNAACEEIPSRERGAAGQGTQDVFRAWMPWLVLCGVLLIWALPGVSHFMHETDVKFDVAGLQHVIDRMPPVVAKPTTETAVFTLNWLPATGTGIMLAALFAGLLLGFRPGTLFKELGRTFFNTRYAMLTIAAMLAIGYVTRYCGLDATLGLAFARTGHLYPFFGTLIGWIGVASTGSDTSSNVLFGSLQTMTAQQIGVSPVLMASANSAGGVMGKMISPSSIVVASTATQNYGQEGPILRFVFGHSLALACLVGIFVYLMAYVHPFTLLVGK